MSRIEFIKKQKESFNNNNIDFTKIQTTDDEIMEMLKDVDTKGDELIESFKEPINFKKIGRSIARGAKSATKKVKSFAEQQVDFFKKVDWNKAINNPVVDEIEKGWKEVDKAFTKFGDDMVAVYKFMEDSNRKTMNNVLDVFKKFSLKKFAASLGIHDLIQGFKDMEKFFKTFPKRFKYVFGGVGGIFIGVLETIEGIFNGTFLGIIQTGELIEYVGEFLFTYLKCTVKMLTNLWSCFFYYIVELFLQILYLPVRIMLFVSKQIFGVDLYAREKQAFQGLYDLSYFMYKYTGYHFMYWPKDIRERCFVCVRLKTSTVEWKAGEVDKAFSKGLPKAIKKGDLQIRQAVEYIKAAFTGSMKVKQLSKGDPTGGEKKKTIKGPDAKKIASEVLSYNPNVMAAKESRNLIFGKKSENKNLF